MAAALSSRSPADWSWQRKTILVVFALIMAYLHSFHLLSLYTSDIEYWGTVWIGVTPAQRLLSFALGLLANFGLMATPFLRAPGPVLRALVALSLTFGLVASMTWLSHDFWVMGLPNLGPIRTTERFAFFIIDVFFFVVLVAIWIFHIIAIVLNSCFFVRVIRGR